MWPQAVGRECNASPGEWPVGVQGEAAPERSPWAAAGRKKEGGSELGAAPDVILTLSPHWVCGVSFFRFVEYHRQNFFLSLEIEIEKEGATDRVSEGDQQLDFKEVGQRDGRNAFNQDRGIHQCRPYAVEPNTLKSLT